LLYFVSVADCFSGHTTVTPRQTKELRRFVRASAVRL